MNHVLVAYGAVSRYGADIPLSVVGIVQKVFGIMISFTVGIAAGSQPIFGHHYGAGEYDRVKKLYKIMMIAEVAAGLAATIAFECFPLQASLCMGILCASAPVLPTGAESVSQEALQKSYVAILFPCALKTAYLYGILKVIRQNLTNAQKEVPP